MIYLYKWKQLYVQLTLLNFFIPIVKRKDYTLLFTILKGIAR